MTAKTLAKAVNSKTKKVYALVANRDATFTVYTLCSNYCGQTAGGVRKTWRVICVAGRPTDRVDYATALKTFNRRAALKAA